MTTRVAIFGVYVVPPNLKDARKAALGLLFALGFAALQTQPAQAITNGQPDDGDPPLFPYVAGVVDPFTAQFCSGVAISSTLVLTSGHCFAAPGQWVWVSFAFDVSPATFPVGWQSGSWYPHPEFCFACSPAATDIDTHDIGVVVLDQEVALDSYAVLPSAGFVDSLPKHTRLTLVGYGLQWDTATGNFMFPEGVFTRHYAEAEIVPSQHVNSNEFIKLSQNPANGKGGDCRGDSGGPNLLNNIVVGLTAYGNLSCTGVGYSQRLDLDYALDFIGSFQD